MNIRQQTGPAKLTGIRMYGSAAMAMIVGALLTWWTVDTVRAQTVGGEDGKRPVLFLGNESLPPISFMKHGKPTGIRVSVAAKGVVMSLDNAVPCGLLMTELVTNALKYAFPEGRPRPGADICEITVSADWDGTAYTLTVADNGVGLPVDLDWTNTDTMGLLLVKMFGQHQLQGRIELDRSCGTSFRLRFEPKDR